MRIFDDDVADAPCQGTSLEEAIAAARQLHDRREELGYDQEALDAAAKEGFTNGSFEETTEEISEIVEEFFTLQESTHKTVSPSKKGEKKTFSIDLKKKLEGKISPLGQ